MTEYKQLPNQELYQLCSTILKKELEAVKKEMKELKNLENKLLRELAQDQKHLTLIK